MREIGDLPHQRKRMMRRGEAVKISNLKYAQPLGISHTSTLLH